MSKKLHFEFGVKGINDLKIFVDDHQIRLIQQIKMTANANDHASRVEIVFPLFNENWIGCENLTMQINESVSLLQEFPQVLISYIVLDV